MKCQDKCEISKDPNTGAIVCIKCGTVIEESAIVEVIEFDGNKRAAGTFVDSNKPSYSANPKKGSFAYIVDPTLVRLNQVYKILEQVAGRLSINSSVVDRAKKLYHIATNKKFTRGRKTSHMVGAILYLACRLDKTGHLLIDFSEVLQINLFVIGSVYLKLIQVMGIIVPLIDPSLFIHRFCGKLEFGDKAKLVGNSALKILQCMSRDWMVTGRRPSGLCGVALLIAARIHGFKRTTQQVTSVVHVCDETIKRRLIEFSKTKIAKMNKAEFEGFQFTEFYEELDPPAFSRNRAKETKVVSHPNLIEKAREIEQMIDNESTQRETTSMLTNLPQIKIEEKKEMFEDTKFFLSQIQLQQQEQAEKENCMLTIDADEQKDQIKTIKPEKEEFLSMIDDKDDEIFFYSSEEYSIKKTIWDALFKDWMEEQKDKKIVDSKNEVKKFRSRKTSKASEQLIPSKTPYEAIRNSSKFGRKLNYPYVKKLFPLGLKSK